MTGIIGQQNSTIGSGSHGPPLVSICIPSYNNGSYLSAAIESALSQTYENIEVVIVDDGSSDGSLAIAEAFACAHPEKVRVLRHPEGTNRGISATINLSLLEARGDYWSVMGADDLLYPEKTRLQVEYLEEHSDVILCHSQMSLIDSSGEHISGLMGSDVSRFANAVEKMILASHIAAPTVMIRLKTLDLDQLMHDEQLVYAEWEVWVRLLAHHRAGFIERPLVKYRVHSSNTCSVDSAVAVKRVLGVMDALSRRAIEVGGELGKPRVRALIELQRSYLLFCAGLTGEAQRILALAFSVDQSLRTDPDYFSWWLNGRSRDFTAWVLRALRQMGVLSGRWLINPSLAFVLMKTCVRPFIGNNLSSRLHRLRLRALSADSQT